MQLGGVVAGDAGPVAFLEKKFTFLLDWDGDREKETSDSCLVIEKEEK